MSLVIILTIMAGGLTYNMFNTNNSKKEILDRVDKLASLEIELMPINQSNYYMLQSSDGNNKILQSLDRIEKSSNTAKRIFDGYNINSLDKNSKNYISTFYDKFAKFKTDKKEFDCLYQAYTEYMSQSNPYMTSTTDPEAQNTSLRTKLEEAKKCGVQLDEIKVEEMFTNYKALNEMTKNMQKQYSVTGAIADKGVYIQPTQAQMDEQNKLSMKYNDISTKFSNSVFAIVNTKYEPLVEYSKFIKTSQDNF